jgi:hypothetical protein
MTCMQLIGHLEGILQTMAIGVAPHIVMLWYDYLASGLPMIIKIPDSPVTNPPPLNLTRAVIDH